MAVAGAVIFGLIAAFSWYFLVYSKKTDNKIANPIDNQSQDASSTTLEVPVEAGTQAEIDPAASSLGAVATNVEQVVPGPETASTTAAEAATSTSVISQIMPTTQTAAAISSSTDSDSDGLTDEEEVLVGTDKAKTDTDGDGYSDLAELQKGYNPAGAGKLSQAKSIGSYDNANFSLIYPSVWQFTASGNDSVIFRTKDEQMIQISVQPNVKNQAIADWYKDQFIGQPIKDTQLISQVDAEGNNLWQGIFSPNGLTVYLTNDKRQKIVSINYDLGFSGKLNYREMFMAMINSFVLKN
jgi:hypothetical protein